MSCFTDFRLLPQCHLSADESRQSVADYMEHECYKGPPSVNHIEHDVSFPGIALDEDGYIVPIMHTDACRSH